MRNLKRALSLTLASVMLLGMMVVGAGAASFPDVDDNDNVEAIEVLKAVNVMIGDNGNFKPDAPVTRNEMAVIMTNMLGLNANDFAGSCPFTDVQSWAQNYVAACYANGIIAGRSATVFDGQATVTATEAAAMMMRALGYFKYPGDYEGGFTAATVRQAATLRLFNGISANANAPMVRNDVAQLALNTLEADVVDFTGTLGFEFNGITQGYVSKYEPRKDLNNVNNGGYNYTKDPSDPGDPATHQKEYLQLLEMLYDGKLTKNTSDTDNMAHTATTWEYDGKDVVTVMNEADYTGYISSKNDTWAKLKDSFNKKLTGGTTYLNGREVTGGYTWTPAIGDYVEVYLDNSNANTIDKIVVTHNTVAKLTADASTKEVDGDTQVRVPGITDLGTFNKDNTTESVHGWQGLVEGDIVLWHRGWDTAGAKAEDFYIQKADSFTGTLSAATSTKYTISGSQYNKSGVTNVLDGNSITVTDFSKEDATWFVDNDNNVVWVKGEESTDIAYVVGIKDDSDNWTGNVGVDEKLSAMLLFADGTVESVTYENASGFTAAQDTFVKYTVKDGVYKLSSGGTYSSAGNGTAGNVANVNGKKIEIKKGNPTIDFDKDGSNKILTNSETIFFIRNWDNTTLKNSFTMYTGYANVPDVDEYTTAAAVGPTPGPASPAKTAVAYREANGYAKYVVINAGKDIVSETSADDMFYVVDASVTTHYKDGDADYYTVKAIKKGGDEIIDLAFDASPSVTDDKAYIAGTYNSDGQIKAFGNTSDKTNGTALTTEDVYVVGTGTGKATGGAFKLDTAGSEKVWGYNDNTVVYYIDADDNLAVRTVADLEDDANDKFVAIKGHKDDFSKGAGTIVALFVREVADPQPLTDAQKLQAAKTAIEALNGTAITGADPATALAALKTTVQGKVNTALTTLNNGVAIDTTAGTAGYSWDDTASKAAVNGTQGATAGTAGLVKGTVTLKIGTETPITANINIAVNAFAYADTDAKKVADAKTAVQTAAANTVNTATGDDEAAVLGKIKTTLQAAAGDDVTVEVTGPGNFTAGASSIVVTITITGKVNTSATDSITNQSITLNPS